MILPIQPLTLLLVKCPRCFGLSKDINISMFRAAPNQKERMGPPSGEPRGKLSKRRTGP